MTEKRKREKEKGVLHPRNRHRQRYDLKMLASSCPELKPYIIVNDYNDESINFFDPSAVRMLNKALLMHYYDIQYWDFSEEYLCPPVPGRADYIHNVADLLSYDNNNHIPRGKNIVCLDIGTGANVIYPLIGIKEYDWIFMGSDIDPLAIRSAKNIIDKNPSLKENLQIRVQENPKGIFNGIVDQNDRIDITICNPPFYSSRKEAEESALKKVRNLKGENVSKLVRNFSGSSNELWCEGGEEKFVRDMISQSKSVATNCLWFSTLVSKSAILPSVNDFLLKVKAVDTITFPMGQGNKISRLVAWTFKDKLERSSWADSYWK